MKNWHDISVPLGQDLPTWPGSPGVRTAALHAIARGDEANVTQLSVDVHTGTHVDAPLHYIEHGETLEELGLDPFIGPVRVVDVGQAQDVSSSVLDAANIPRETDRLLLRTTNSARAGIYSEGFRTCYVALTLDAAEWIADRGICLVGIDYLSIQGYGAPADVHRVLLRARVAILEGISLAGVAPGVYELVCLPVRLSEAEAAPARAILVSPATVRR